MLVKTHSPAPEPGPRGPMPPVLCKCSVPGRSQAISSLPSGETGPPTWEDPAWIGPGGRSTMSRSGMSFFMRSQVALGPGDCGTIQKHFEVIDGRPVSAPANQDDDELLPILVGYVDAVVGRGGTDAGRSGAVAHVRAYGNVHDVAVTGR